MRCITETRAVWVKHDTAADRVLLRCIANHKAVAAECEDRRFKLQIRDCFLAGLKSVPFKQLDSRGHSQCAVMHINRASIFTRASRLFFDAKSGRFSNL